MPPNPGAPQLCTGPTGNSGMTKPIVALALLSICQHAVSFGCFFEFLFGARVVWVFVRVITSPPDGDRRS